MSGKECHGFGFVPEESQHHFVVRIPAGKAQVTVSEHLSWGGDLDRDFPMTTMRGEDFLRVVLDRFRWDAIADATRDEFNPRMRKWGFKATQWKAGAIPMSRLLGKELTLLAWAIEEADPATFSVAVQNWLGLMPEERWWLYSMTSAATGKALEDRGRGWRRAVRYALCENPVTPGASAPRRGDPDVQPGLFGDDDGQPLRKGGR